MIKPQTNVRIPQIVDLSTAIRIYYSRIEVSNADIRELFGPISSVTITKLKKVAADLMNQEDVPMWNSRCVNTETAFKAWGIDIQSLERRRDKLKKYGMIEEVNAKGV